MVFLKRIEIIGFKSFANKTVINFQKSLVGIVGPNGSGKSNINDAIKWVFGIQSSKFLRSNVANDIIFNGSETKEKSNYAQVKLFFDNSNKIFDLDYHEVEISKRIFRDSSESEYYLNNTRCKLKEIKMFAKESGLTKSSLSIISQGNVSSFAESKPFERRMFLEDACGISKSKQYKYETNKKLESASQNLNRLKDIIFEIERRIPKLKKDYKKALEFKKVNDRLKEIEVQILVYDINDLKNKQKEFSSVLNDLKKTKEKLLLYIDENGKKLLNNENNLQNLINEITNEHHKYNSIINKISELKISKITSEQTKNTNKNNDISDSIKTKFNSYKNDIYIDENRLKILNKNNENLQKDLNLVIEKIEKFLKNKKKLEYEIFQNDKKIFNITNQISSLNKLFLGVTTILDNKEYLKGILCTVKDLINIEDKYRIAFSTILNSNLQNIIVNNKNDAKEAINFLKKNKAGKATFIPLDVKIPRQINNNEIYILKTINGFIDIASNIFDYDDKYHNLMLYLLSRHIICEDIDSAIQIAKLTNYSYMITTLDGTQIKPYGVLTGGYKKNINESSLFIPKYKTELAKIKEKSLKINNEIILINEKITQLRITEKNLESTITQNNFSIINIENNKNKLIDKLNNLKENYNFLELNKESENNNILLTKILDDLKQNIVLRDNIENKINILQNNRNLLYAKINKSKQEINLKSSQLTSLNEEINTIDRKILQVEFILKENLQRLLLSYMMTYDHAKTKVNWKMKADQTIRNEVESLKSKLKVIGNVNLSAIDEYEIENSRYNKLKDEYNNLTKSTEIIKKSITQIDKIMIEKFENMISKINLNLIKTFSKLFNGGKARLIYTEPHDVLNTGIEIEVMPPGKKISNINLLSGGEKSLVALSVLFSILESNPLPLVILDEVEAPLDYSNLKGFAKYLNTISHKTQFIVVTHRITTMENCDTLYGVTMQEKGISKIVSVELLEAKKIINNLENINNKNETIDVIKV